MTPRAEKTQQKTQEESKSMKIVKISIKLRVFSDRLFERRHVEVGRRGGCTEGGAAGEGEGWGGGVGWATVGWGGQHRDGGK